MASRARGFALPAIGFSFFWPVLHASPYYPFALSHALMGQGAGAVSSFHVLYSLELALFSAVAFALFRKVDAPSVPARPLAVSAAASATVGSILFVASDGLAGPSGVLVGVAVTLVSFGVVALLVLWFARMSLLPLDDIVLAVVSSYAVSSAVWLVLQAALPAAVVPFTAACPLISAAFLVLDGPFAVGTCGGLGNLGALHWGVIAFCLVLSCVGAVCIRSITTMETGATLMGDIASSRSIITAACSLAIAAVAFAYCQKASYRVSFLIVVVAFLSLVAIGALLIVVLSNAQGLPALAGKRIFVSVEHCFDVLLAALLMRGISRHRLPAVALAAFYGVFVCAIPQFLSFDLMYQTGALGQMESAALVIPIAALVSFSITVAVVAGLVGYVSDVSHAANERSGNWERELCKRATASVGLTQRELEVVELTYRGYTAKSIAKELFVSESTVKAHLAHAYRKLDVHTKQALIEYIDGFRSLA